MFVKSKRISCILATSDARTMLISIIPTVAIAVGVGVSVGGESNKSVLEMIIKKTLTIIITPVIFMIISREHV